MAINISPSTWKIHKRIVGAISANHVVTCKHECI